MRIDDSVCIHEIGHLLEAEYWGTSCKGVLVFQSHDGTDSAGATLADTSPLPDETVVRIAAAGPLAECLFAHTTINTYSGWGGDLELIYQNTTSNLRYEDFAERMSAAIHAVARQESPSVGGTAVKALNEVRERLMKRWEAGEFTKFSLTQLSVRQAEKLIINHERSFQMTKRQKQASRRWRETFLRPARAAWSIDRIS